MNKIKMSIFPIFWRPSKTPFRRLLLLSYIVNEAEDFNPKSVRIIGEEAENTGGKKASKMCFCGVGPC